VSAIEVEVLRRQLRKYCDARGWARHPRTGECNRYRLMKETGLNKSTVYGWFENQKKKKTTKKKTNPIPDAESLRVLSEKLDVSIDWLLGFDGVPMRRSEREALHAIKPKEP